MNITKFDEDLQKQLKKSTRAACMAIAVIARDFDPGYKLDNSKIHQMLGLQFGTHHDCFVLRQLKQYYGNIKSPDMAELVISSQFINNDINFSDRKFPGVHYILIQEQMGIICENIKKTIINLGPNKAYQSNISKNLEICYPDIDHAINEYNKGKGKDESKTSSKLANNQYFIMNISNMMANEGIIERITVKKKVYYRIINDKKYQWVMTIINEKRWIGEHLMTLIIAGYTFETQVKYPYCRGVNPLPFDFRIINRKGDIILLEVDGGQHRRWIKYFHKTIAEFEKAQYHDRIKNNFTRDNNIFLLRVEWENGKFNIPPEEIINYIDNPYMIDY